jgi:hypothetical protein
MFLRSNHRIKDGKDHTYWSLVETVRFQERARVKSPSLDLALIVRGADVQGQEHLCCESLGLRAIAQGFTFSGISDEERLAKEFPLYDALYEYVRQKPNEQ